jgi:hypothetical protein
MHTCAMGPKEKTVYYKKYTVLHAVSRQPITSSFFDGVAE